ncbi:phBC6A51 family helix-turn-helix protein [Heliophilum fasciatum]|uniref:Putative insertion element HTH domain-containing protein n=1 Tax=Heliophilum fasciatum TaxID=35700 RepID=A0A4R2RIJ9_9FIRM|nr:phBC6A51 family helix-turn-helix protein [Heliophilum fasciatum]MCW2278723.1 AcrR family transcriptional regulator [Heliophilum fasciatum]TCP62538.1 putative insertion element HTH domain-containing protein [Heliophilum fasciatum]
MAERKVKSGRNGRAAFAVAPEQAKAAELFVGNELDGRLTIAEIAEQVGVSERTIYRWKQDPEFLAYQNYLADLLMEDFITEAYVRLRGLVRADNEKTQLKALELLLKNRGKLTDVKEITATVEDNRSDEALAAEIEELKKALGE